LSSSRPVYVTVIIQSSVSLQKKDKMAEKQQGGLVIINDHQFLSDLLGGLLKDQGFELIRSFTDAEMGLAYILTSPPDLVIIDMMLPIMRTRSNGKADIYHPYVLMDTQTSFRTVRQIHSRCPKTKILILTGERHPHTFHLGFEAGAHGIASKLDDSPSFLKILQHVMAGEEYVMSERMQLLLKEYRRNPMPVLTAFEVQVLELVQEGLESPEIGRQLGYSAKTIRNTLSKINEKLGTANRIQALETAIDIGLVGWRMGHDGS
jgi:DNA-binding NarL/FixJ family response regulator